MDFAEYLTNQTLHRIEYCVMAGFCEMDFMKGFVILVKADEIHNILKSASHC